MRAFIIVSIVLGFACAETAAQQTYRWVDKDGGVHYTQSPPPAGAAKEVQSKRLSGSTVETSGPSYAMQMAMRDYPVTLYTAPDCGAACKDAQDHLNKRGAPFREVAISDAKGAEELKKITGAYQVPVMKVGSQVLVGFEPGQWKDALDSAGYPALAQPLRARPPESRPAKIAAVPSTPVKLYSNSKCGSPCADAQQFLSARGINQEVVQVETPESFEELRKLTGGATVPVLVVGETVLIGYSPARWGSALDAAGFPPAAARASQQ